MHSKSYFGNLQPITFENGIYLCIIYCIVMISCLFQPITFKKCNIPQRCQCYTGKNVVRSLATRIVSNILAVMVGPNTLINLVQIKVFHEYLIHCNWTYVHCSEYMRQEGCHQYASVLLVLMCHRHCISWHPPYIHTMSEVCKSKVWEYIRRLQNFYGVQPRTPKP